ncbi:MAG: cysteine peptidase family C39 domain-containing protein [Phycisphaerales bacterium]|nr:cysteine peptidase family C39 domain-containing protein [Phycisphaerales bacterium]
MRSILSRSRWIVAALLLICTGVAADEKAGVGGGQKKNVELQCGHWGVLRSCQLLGVMVDRGTILAALPYAERGHSLAQLQAVFERLGVKAEGRVETLERLASVSLPAILHVGGSHFVVLTGIADRLYSVYDMDEPLKRWT